MKRLFFVLACILSLSAFAQKLSEGFKAKNAGNEAYRMKDYISAIKNWEKYFSSGESGIAVDSNTLNLYTNSLLYAAEGFLKKQDFKWASIYYEKYDQKAGKEPARDGRILFNMAYTAFKLNKSDAALNYFRKSVEIDYKSDVCKFYIASIYRSMDKEEKMKEILIEAIEQYPNSNYIEKMESMLRVPLLKEASIPFNSANELAKAASLSTPDSYVAKLESACEKFQESIPLFEKVLKYNPQNEQAINCLKICEDNIKLFNDYKASLIK